MDTFFNYLRKILVGCIALVFAFIVTYTPQDYTKEAHAGAAAGGASEWTQLANFAMLFVSKAQTVVSAISTGLMEKKELVLDGMAWTVFKTALAAMSDSMIAWVEGGFRDGPAFVQDLEQFLRREADAVIGNYLNDLMGEDSFLCKDFRPNITVALRESNLLLRNTPSSCTLTDIIDNVEDFVSGDQGSFSRGGGWSGWFEVTRNPGSNTYFGSLTTAQGMVTEKRLAKQGEEQTKLGWGNGFFSISSCNGQADEAFNPECAISTPGQLIQQALTNNLDSNRQALLEADELNEALGAFFTRTASGGLQALGSSAIRETSLGVDFIGSTGGGAVDNGAREEAARTRTELEDNAEQLELDAEEARSEVQSRSAEEAAEAEAYVSEEKDEAVGEVVGGVGGAVNRAIRESGEEE